VSLAGKGPLGTFYGVGVGPGDPELMTLKAVRIIQDSGVLAAPFASLSPGARSRALEVAGGALDLGSKDILRLHLPMTRDEDALRAARREAASLVAEKLRDALDVAFVTLGDPMLYSTFVPLASLVSERLGRARIVAVPGVTSPSAAASLAGVPLASADERVALVPAVYGEDVIREALDGFDTVVLMKINRVFDSLMDILGERGDKRETVFVSNAGMEDQEVVTDAGSMRGAEPGYFSMLISRRVAARDD